MKKTPRVDMYDPVIYPRLLWVSTELEGGDAAHEAVHIADYIFEQLGMYSQQFHDNNEQYAYLVGWAAGCISKTIIKNIKNDTRRESDDVEA